MYRPRIVRIYVKSERSTLSCVLQADPKRVKKTLPKILKGMKPDDRVMIIGTSKSPFSKTGHSLGSIQLQF